MTILQAISANLYPYDVDRALLTKACIDCELSEESVYTAAVQKSVVLATIEVLQKLIVLSSESDGGFSLSYDTDKLKERIHVIAKKNGLHDIAEEYNPKSVIIDRTDLW